MVVLCNRKYKQDKNGRLGSLAIQFDWPAPGRYENIPMIIMASTNNISKAHKIRNPLQNNVSK